MVLLTVFTPTYNRAHTLPEAYCSLKAQTSKNFLWLIVDDGSTDRTAALVSAWMQAEKAFAIRYLYRPNGGMHAAHNTAYAHIETELNLCLDSDDRLAKDAVEQIEKRWAQIKSKNYAGLIGLDDDGNGKLIGTGFPPGLTETTLSGYYAGGGKGDKKLVYRTDIIRKYSPYPEFPNEKYVALAAKYRLIDRDYKLAVLNRVLCHVTYLEDGSSHTMWKQYAKNPRGFLYWRQLCLTYPAAATRTVLDSIHYDAACFLAKKPALMLRSPKKVLTMLCRTFRFDPPDGRAHRTQSAKGGCMIPKIIHYCWFGRAPLPDKAKKCIESWRKHCPDYTILEWNEDNFDIHQNGYTEMCCKEKKYAFLADYARLQIIENEGGFYFDVDVELVRSLDPLCSEHAFFAFETDRMIATGLGFGAEKHHPLVHFMLEQYAPLLDGKHGVIGCPQLNTQALLKCGLKPNGKRQTVQGAAVFPKAYFNPYEDATGRLYITDCTYAVHWYAKSWMNRRTVLRSKLTRPLHRLLADHPRIKEKVKGGV